LIEEDARCATTRVH